MRNLKKALALVLAMMMALSLMSFASAADYADNGSVTKNEAVDVMSAINVFQGTDGGNFDPTGELTRAQAAKIIAYMKLGPAVAEALPKDEAPFGDVKADRWYTGYVTYAKAEGIINGRSDEVFDPNGKVTGYEFGKMVLEAAGIPGEYSGTGNWKLNVNTALRGGNPAKTDLLANVGMATLAPNITREQACQLAFNALTYTPNAQGTGKFKISGVTNPGGVAGGKLNGIVCDTRTEALMMISVMGEASGIDYTVAEEKDASGSLADVVFGLKSTSGTTAFGATGTQWQQKDANGAYQNLVLVANKPALTYTGAVTGGKIYTDLGGTGTYNLVNKAGTQIANTVVEDGNDATKGTLAIASGNTQSIGGNGTKIDVYVSGTNVKVVMVNTYVGTIASHTDAKGDAKEFINVTADSVKPAASNGVTPKFETSAFTADDKGKTVLYTATTDGTDATIQSVSFPAEATGTVTRTSGTGASQSFVMGGVTYKWSAKKVSAVLTSSNVGKELSVYLDNAGNVIKVKDAAPAATQYAVMLKAVETAGSLDTSSTVQARLLLADGSTADKTITKVNNSTSFTAGGLNGNAGKIYTYVFDGDNAELTLLDVIDDGTGLETINKGTVAANTVTLGTGVTRNKPTLKAGVVANKDTVFFITSADGKTCEKYVGISAVPSFNVATKGTAGTDQDFADNAEDIQVAVENGIAKLVYVHRGQLVDGGTTSSDVIYITSGVGEQIIDETGTYFEYSAVVNGEIKTVKATVDTLGGKLYKGTKENDKGLVTEGTVMGTTDGAFANAGAAVYGVSVDVNGGNITAGGVARVYTENTKVFLFDGEELAEIAVSAIENDVDDKVWGYTDKDGAIAMLFIEKSVCDHSEARTHHDAGDASATNCNEKTNVEYWDCPVCGKHFNASTDGTEITDVNTVDGTKHTDTDPKQYLNQYDTDGSSWQHATKCANGDHATGAYTNCTPTGGGDNNCSTCGHDTTAAAPTNP